MNFELIIVDDDPEYIFFHKLLAKKSGISENPLTFQGGKELLDHLNANCNPHFKNTLILLDIYMIPMDGWAVLDYLTSLNCLDKIKVVLITSSVNLNDKRKAMQYPGVIEYIEKPLMINNLVELVNRPLFQ